MGTIPIALLLLAWGASLTWGSSEAAYKKKAAGFRPVDIVSGPQLDQARRAEPGKSLQLSGVIQGIFTVRTQGAVDAPATGVAAGAGQASVGGEQRTVLLQLVDGTTAEFECAGNYQEVHPRSRVRCLVKPAEPSPTAPLKLVDITWDKTPIEVLQEAARAALKFPPSSREEIAQSAAQLQRAQQPTPTRGGDQTTVIKRAIATLNPRLSARDVDLMGDSIITYSAKYNVDPTLVVAVIAAESRFNPNARSYKGAMGLGQLMPATAAAHNVDAWDPIENLHLAVRIIRKNLDKFGGDWNKALAAYNAGTGAVSRYGGVPPYRETRNYLWKIYEYWCWLNNVQPEPRPR
ncbi:MAG: lytic transglycosylase domain-containing protein [Armatimonadota bacterium]